jgi:hypothetical protein
VCRIIPVFPWGSCGAPMLQSADRRVAVGSPGSRGGERQPTVEALPVDRAAGFLHCQLIPLLGMPVGEFWGACRPVARVPAVRAL